MCVYTHIYIYMHIHSYIYICIYVYIDRFFFFLSGHLFQGISFCQRNPDVLQAVLVYSLASAVGQNFIYYTITQFNPLLLST